jgi:hypothetical protein
MRIRRLAAGELAGEERARTKDHLAACARCQATDREIAAERARLGADLPFEAFAAGVAERLARERPRPARRAATLRVAMALAAGLAFAVSAPTVLRVARERPDAARTKGGAEVTVWVGGRGAARVLGPGEPVPPGAALRVALSPAGRRFAAVALVDADGAAVLHAGAAQAGVVPGAFEWTGAGEATLVAVLDDAPIDPIALRERLARDGPAAAAPGPGALVVVRPLRRDAR